MRITCIALGSRGDVQPYIALGVGLRRAGHQVTIGSHDEFAPLIREHGLNFHAMGGNPRAMLETEAAHAMLASGKNALRFLKLFSEITRPIFRQFLAETLLACREADGIIYSNGGVFAHRYTPPPVPYCTVFLQPFTATSAFASPFLPEYPAWLPAGRRLYNRSSHRIFNGIFWHFFGRPLLDMQREMGLPLPTPAESRTARCRPACCAFSPSLIPRPADWPPHLHITGYLFLDHAPGWQPPAELTDFLAAGPPPVYIGFGSMRSRDPEETAAMAIAALQQAGQRGILLRGWGGLQQRDVPDDILLIDAVPHDWLFPRTAAVVHHGGAGTTAAGLRAGVPSIITPFFADQPFWARTIHHAGVGPHPIPRKALTADRLAAAIRQAATDADMRARAAELGRRIQTENGVENAVEIIIRHFETAPTTTQL